MGGPDVDHPDDAGLDIDLDLGDVGRGGVGRAGPDGAAPVVPADRPGAVAAGGAQGAGGGLGQHHGPPDGELPARLGAIVDKAQRHPDLVRGDRPVSGDALDDAPAQRPGGLPGGDAAHEGDPRGVGAQVHRGQVGVRGDHHHVLGGHAGLLGDDVGQHGVAALADVAGPAEGGDLAGAIASELHRGLGHLVGVDRVGRARDVHRAGHPQAPAPGQPTAAPPAAGGLDRVQALAQAGARHELAVDGLLAAAHGVAAAELDGVQLQSLGQLVEGALEGEAGLHRAVAALGAAAGLVGVDPAAAVAVAGEAHRAGQELAGVVGGDHAEGVVGPAVDEDVGVHRREPPVGVGGEGHLHGHGVPAPVGVEDLLAGVEDLHRPPGRPGQPGGAELQVEGLGLAAEGPAQSGLDDPNLRLGQLQHVGQGAVQVVRHLGGAPQGELAVCGPARQGAVRLDRGVGGALVVPGPGDPHRGLGELSVDLAEAQRHGLADVVPALPTLPVHLVDQRRALCQGRRGLHRRGQHLVVHRDQLQGPDGGVLVDRRHSRHAVADIAHLVGGQGRLIGGPGDHAVGPGQIRAGHHREDAGQGLGGAGVDGADARVGVRRAQDLAVGHARQAQVVGVEGLAGGLGDGVGLAPPGPEHQEALGRLAEAQRHPAVHALGGHAHGLDDLGVARTAAEVAREGLADRLLAGVGVTLQQRLGREDHPRLAEAALQGAGHVEGPLHGVGPVRAGQALDGGDLPALAGDRQRAAGQGGLAVDQHGAGAAVALVAALLAAGQSQLVAEHLQQRPVVVGGDLAALAVDTQLQDGLHRGSLRARDPTSAIRRLTPAPAG